MKVENRIQIDGALSRNRAIRSLKSGDSVTVKIITILDRNTAVIDLIGNRVKAHFQGSVPENKSLTLNITGSKNGMLIFSLMPQESNDKNPFQHYFMIDGFEQSLAFLRTEITDFFTLFKNFYLKDEASHFKAIAQFYHHLRKKFGNKKSAIVSDFIAEQNGTQKIGRLIQNVFGVSEKEEYAEQDYFEVLDELDEEETRLLFQSLSKKKFSFFIQNAGYEYTLIQTITDKNFTAAHFTVPGNGEVEMIAVENEKTIIIDLFFENLNFKNLIDESKFMLDKKLKSITKIVYVRTFDIKKSLADINSASSGLKIRKNVDFKV
jgi:hypothetical protein